MPRVHSSREIVGGLGIALVLGSSFFLGCGGEPTGDAAFSQKFEQPPEVASQLKDPSEVPADPYAEERQRDIEASRKAAASKNAKGK
ncbi:MAG: hypothetical protein AB7I30_14135 [Isosphaeraceae bacterium]